MNYKIERDEAAEKIITPRFGGSVQYCLRGNHHNDALTDFKQGADWSNARAEKRAQVLVEALEKLHTRPCNHKYSGDCDGCAFHTIAGSALLEYKGESDG